MADRHRRVLQHRARRAILAALLAAACFGFARQSSAQDALDAQAVASLVQSFYDQTTTIAADFHQTQYTKLYDRTERARGHVVFKKPGKMRWDYASPNGQVFVSDGQRLSIYQPPDEGEQGGQLIERPLSEDQLPQAFSFLTGTGRLDRDFHLRLLDPRRQGFPDGYVLELRPRVPSANYEKVLFFVQVVEQGGRRAGIIKRVLIIDAAGNRNRFDFRNMRFNTDVPDRTFQFTAPRGTRRVEP